MFPSEQKQFIPLNYNKDFLAAIDSIRAKTFTLRTIQLGFRLSGIWPMNPENVCEIMMMMMNSFARCSSL